MAKMGFGKGDIVKVREDAFGQKWDSSIKDHVPETTIRARYYYTEADKDRMRKERMEEIKKSRARGEDTFGLVFDDAGEPRLMRSEGVTYLKRGMGYRVLKARCRQYFNYRTTGGWTQLLDLESGREVFIKGEKLERVEA
jgi:hypothetical protein